MCTRRDTHCTREKTRPLSVNGVTVMVCDICLSQPRSSFGLRPPEAPNPDISTDVAQARGEAPSGNTYAMGARPRARK